MFFRQIRALCRKNTIVLFTYWIANSLRCFIGPVAFATFIATAQIFLIKPDQLGINQPGTVRELADVYKPEYKLVWADGTTTTGALRPSDIMQRATRNFSPSQLENLIKLDSVDDIPTACPQNFNLFSECWVAIEFRDTFGSSDVDYTIRGDGGFGYVNVDRHTSDSEIRIFPIQWALDSAIIYLRTGKEPPPPQEWPFTQLTNEEQRKQIRLSFNRGIREILVLALFVAFLGIVYHLPGSFMQERATGVTSLMKGMGLMDSSRIISWHVSLDLAYLPAWIFMGLIWRSRIFSLAPVGIMIGTHLVTGLSLASWSMLVSVPFGKSPQLASIVTTFLAIVLAIMALVLKARTGMAMIYTLIFPPGFYIFVISAICGFENNETKTSFSKGDPDRGIRIAPIFFVAVLDIFIYPILAIWLERSRYDAGNPNGFLSRLLRRQVPAPEHPEGTAISVKNLKKVFTTGMFRRNKIIAIDDLTLTVPKNGIFVLLGANGSGKTTLLSIIANLLSRNNGTVTFDGNRLHPPNCTLGIVPQKSVLHPELSCLQTMRLWQSIKGTSNSTFNREEPMQCLKDCDLENKWAQPAGQLSGGQKRKLQLAIGMVGGSRLLLLDECTAGVDPVSRREIWRTLTAIRHDRTIVFTTHFLDEADLLGDTIAILAAPGKLLANGSPVVLKNTMGVGYTASIALRDELSSENSAIQRIEPLLRQVLEHAPEAKCTAVGRSSASLLLKLKDTAAVGRVLDILEASKVEGNIAGYDVHAASLEDIFINLMERHTGLLLNHEGQPDDSLSTPPSEPNPSPIQATAKPLNLATGRRVGRIAQAWVIFRKRLLILRRSWLSTFGAIAVAVLGACIPLFYLKNRRQTCEIFFRPTYPEPLYWPQSYVGSNSLYPFSGGNQSSLLQVAPNTVLQTLSGELDVFPVSPQSSREGLIQTIQSGYRDLTIGGIFVDTNTSETLFAFQAKDSLAGPTLLNLAANVLYSNYTSTTGDLPGHILANYMTFPMRAGQNVLALRWLTFFGGAMAVFPAFFTLYVNKERRSFVQAMQLSNGISNPEAMWLGHLLFDGMFTVIAVTIIVVVFATVEPDQFKFIGIFWFVLVLYGYTGTLFSYLVSLWAKSALAAFSIAAGYQVVMFLLYLTAYLLTLTYEKSSRAPMVVNITHFTMSLLAPVNSVLRATFVCINLFNLLCEGEVFASSVGDIERLGGSILYLICYGVVLFGVLVWVDNGRPLPRALSLSTAAIKLGLKKRPADTQEKAQEDVLGEIAAVEKSVDSLRVLHVSKSFGTNKAVDDVSFGVAKDAIFAMLGPNGAGKTTTFNIIRGEMKPDAGDVLVNGHSVVHHSARARVYLGVCPQETPLDSQLTAREHLRIYGMLKGLRSGTELDSSINELLRVIMLDGDKLANKLSGGNQRKLVLAIALMGNPSVILIDEFSTGIAPDTKRNLWTTLRGIVPGKAVVITTHSMEEASALANRVGIISQRMLAVGTTDELTSKYPFYEVHVPCHSQEEVVRARQLQSSIPGARMADDVATRIEVPITNGDDRGVRSLAELFSILSRENTSTEFSVDRVNLESVFLKVIRENQMRTEESDTASKAWWRCV